MSKEYMKESIDHQRRFLTGALKELENRHPGITDTIGMIPDDDNRLDAAINALEIAAEQAPSQKINHLSRRGRIFRNGVTPDDLFPQQIFGRDKSRLLKGALQQAEKQLPGLMRALVFLPESVRIRILAENLDQLANSAQEPKNKGQFDTLATTVAALTQEKKVAPASQEEALTSALFNQEILPKILATTLTTGQTLGEALKQQAAEATGEKLTKLTTIANQPLSEVLEQMKNSMKAGKQTKEAKLAAVENVAETAEQRSHLKWDIDSLNFNLSYLEQLTTAGATYDNFAQIIAEMAKDARHSIVDGNEHHLQALESLKIQITEAARKRHHQTVRPDGVIIETGAIAELTNIREEAVALYIKQLSEQGGDDGTISQQANAIMADRLLQANDQTGQAISLAKILEKTKNRSETNYLTILEILARLGIDPTKIDLAELVSATYSTGSLTDTHHLKGQLWEMFRPIIEQDYGVDLTEMFEGAINQVCNDPPLEIMVEVESRRQTKQLTNQLFTWSKMALEQLQLSHLEQMALVQSQVYRFCRLAAALFEIDRFSLDKPLNPNQLPKEVAEAVFGNTPMQVTYIKSHRWCYPNGQVAVSPHAGDFETLTTGGQPIARFESTEIAKVKRVYERVVAPLLFHGIAVARINILQSGEEQLKLFGFSEGDQAIQDARAYVEDLRKRVVDWKIFPEGMEVAVVSFADLIRDNPEIFTTVQKMISDGLEKMKQDNEFKLVGVNNRERERMIDLEHDRKMEFIRGWTRENSRSYVEGLIKLFVPTSVLVARFAHPHIMVAMGEAHGNRIFSHAHEVADVAPTVILSLVSINDGQVETSYVARTDLISPMSR